MAYAGDTSGLTGMRETFDTMNVIYPKKNYVIDYEMTAGVQEGPWNKPYGIAFVGDKGTIVVNRNGYDLYPEYDGSTRSNKTESRTLSGISDAHGPHVRNFLECIKTRETPLCTVEMGYAAALHAHIPNIAGRVGMTQLDWNEEEMRFTNSEAANELVTPRYRAPWRLPEV